MASTDAAYSTDGSRGKASVRLHTRFVTRLDKKREQGQGKVDFYGGMAGVFCCGLGCIIVYALIILAIHIAMIVMGALHLKDCPRERFIPIYLIVGGCVGILHAALYLILGLVRRRQQQKRGEADNIAKYKPNIIHIVLAIFLLAWFIAGNIWVFRAHNDYQSDDPDGPKYCHQTLYLFAFWLLITFWIMLLLSAFFYCCACCLSCIFFWKK